jgi:predicted nucleic acid-binding protein
LVTRIYESQRLLAEGVDLNRLGSGRGERLTIVEVYRTLRHKGITIRNSVDCMIASVAIENDIMLLHNDKDFLPIEKHLGLKVLTPT